jgi:hypothetical protein
LRSIVFTGDGRVDQDETKALATDLSEIRPSEDIGSANSIWRLHDFIPSVRQDKDPTKRVFVQVSEFEEERYIRSRRLASPLHYRFYFALCAPKTALPDPAFQSLLVLAESDPTALAEKLLEYLSANVLLTRNWFERVLDRFNDGALQEMPSKRLEGLAVALSDVMDQALAREEPRFIFGSIAQRADHILGRVVRILRERGDAGLSDLMDRIFADGVALGWFVGDFFRSELFDHGIVGDRAKHEQARNLTREELNKYREMLAARMTDATNAGTVDKLPKLARVLYGWRDLAGVDAVKAWIDAYILDDRNFINILHALRGHAVSDRVYHPLHKGEVEPFLDWEATVGRFNKIYDAPPADDALRLKLKEIQQAIIDGQDR